MMGELGRDWLRGVGVFACFQPAPGAPPGPMFPAGRSSLDAHVQARTVRQHSHVILSVSLPTHLPALLPPNGCPAPPRLAWCTLWSSPTALAVT